MCTRAAESAAEADGDASARTEDLPPTPPLVQARVPEVIEQRVAIRFTYPVHFTRDLFRPENPVLRRALTRAEPERRHRCLVIIDDGVASAWPALPEAIRQYAAAHADAVALAGPPRVLPGGEAAKNDPALAARVVGWVNEQGIDRQSFVVCIGGGALQDAVGYAAATAHRGVRLVRVPTTVLSQNDSGVGVKNGINAFGKKNFTGTFAPPFAVLNDLDFIGTLSRREAVAGMSEAVKVALIRDAAFFRWMEANSERLSRVEPDAADYLIRRCAQLHLEHIATSGDPFELGSARPLDFGHWAAHKLESMTHNRLCHGDAVAIGVALDASYSARTGHLSAGDANRVVALLEALGLRLWDEALDLSDEAGRPRVLEGLHEFREHLGGELTVTLLRAIGRGFEAHEIDETLMCASLADLRRRDRVRCG